jgi:hypothetical protein
MKTYKAVQVQAESVEKIICNMCGRTIEKHSFGYLDNFLSVEKAWGYGTEWDGETHRFELCEECYKKLIESFKIPVLSANDTSGDSEEQTETPQPKS